MRIGPQCRRIHAVDPPSDGMDGGEGEPENEGGPEPDGSETDGSEPDGPEAGGQGESDASDDSGMSPQCSDERCNLADDDCDGEIDESMPCQANQGEVACTTSCGSTGVGVCSASCELPAGDACLAPVETCNGKDDDCDGLIDVGLTRRVPVDGIAEYPKDESGRGYEHAQMALVAGPDSGANVLYRAAYGGLDAPPTQIRGYATARPDVAARDVAEHTRDVATFLGAGDEQFTVLVQGAFVDGFVAGQANPLSLRLQAYRASDLSFVGELVPVETRRQQLVGAVAVSVMRSRSGELSILFAYVRQTPEGKQSTAFRIAHLSPAGEWGFTTRETELASVPLLRGVKIGRLPCRDEFVLGAIEVSGAASTRTLRRVDAPSGSYVGGEMAPLLGSASILMGLGDEGASCTAASSADLLAGYVSSSESSETFMQHLSVDNASGVLTTSGTPFPIGVGVWAGMWITRSSGRWFFSTWAPDGADHGPTLWEHWRQDLTQGALRAIPLLDAQDPNNANPGAKQGATVLGACLGALVGTSEGVLAGFANLTGPGTPDSKLDRSLAARQGRTPAGVAAAAHYRVGCR